MNAIEKLLIGLRKQDYLSAEGEFNDYSALESAIVTHLLGSQQELNGVVHFDLECIENDYDYSHLIQLFIAALPQGCAISEVSSYFDAANARAGCVIEVEGVSKSADWAQNSDWVTFDFIDFMLQQGRCSKGRFVPIDTGDQNFLAIFLNKGLSAALEKYRFEDIHGRNGFFRRHNTSPPKYNPEILPRHYFQSALSGLRESFGNQGDLLDPGAYESEQVRGFITLRNIENPLECYQAVQNSGAFRYYLKASEYDYGWFCPDETAYLLSLGELENEVIIEIPAQQAGIMKGECDASFPHYALIGKQGDWGIIVNQRDFIVLGHKVIELLGAALIDSRDNRCAALYEPLIQQWYRPLIEQLGYAQYPGMFSSPITVQQHRNHFSQVRISASQTEIDGPLIIHIKFFVFNPLLDHVYSNLELVDAAYQPEYDPSSIQLCKYIELEYQIADETDFQQLLIAPDAAITEVQQQLDQDLPLAKWIEIYSAAKLFWLAAIAAHYLGDQAQVEHWVAQGIDSTKNYSSSDLKAWQQRMAALLKVALE